MINKKTFHKIENLIEALQHEIKFSIPPNSFWFDFEQKLDQAIDVLYTTQQETKGN